MGGTASEDISKAAASLARVAEQLEKQTAGKSTVPEPIQGKPTVAAPRP